MWVEPRYLDNWFSMSEWMISYNGKKERGLKGHTLVSLLDN